MTDFLKISHLISRRLFGLAFSNILFVTITLVSQTRGQDVKIDSALVGLDHVVIAVNDLEAAARQFQKLGFSLKPGRPHANGIRNQHVKFPDGTEIELLTAPEARDSLTAEYRRHLAAGDGPAFFALYAPQMNEVAQQLDGGRFVYQRSGGFIEFPAQHQLQHIFFGGRNHSPSDRPEHFAHPNTASSLIAVRLAGDDLKPELDLLKLLGGLARQKVVPAPEPVAAQVVAIRDGDVYLLPASRHSAPERRIVGVTVRVKDLAAAQRALERGGINLPIQTHNGKPQSLFLPPSLAHGTWLELREVN